MSKDNMKRERIKSSGNMGANIIKTSQKKNMKQLIIILSVFAAILSFVITFVIVFNQSKKSVIANQLATPENVRIEESLDESGSRYDLMFDPVKHADYYAIYLFEGEDEVLAAVEENFVNAIPYITTTRTMIDVTDSVETIGEYYYSVQAVYRKIDSYSSLLSDPYKAKISKFYTLQTPNVVAQSTRTYVSVNWRSVYNAAKYAVKYELDIRYKETGASLLDKVETISGNSYTVPQNILDQMTGYTNNEFVVKVKAVSANKFVYASDYGEAQIFTYKQIQKPEITDYSLVDGKYSFEWEKLDYAEGYYVFINGNLATTITNNDETSYEFEPENYGEYSVRVQGYNTSNYVDDSEMSDVVNLPTYRGVTSKVTNLNAERINGNIRLSWIGEEKTYHYIYIQKESTEEFVDANGNGFYDVGEEFVDANNNGVYDGGFITKPGSTQTYYERLDSLEELYFPLDLNETGYYKIRIKSVSQKEFYDPSPDFVQIIVRFDETNGTKLKTPTIEYDEFSQSILYSGQSQTKKEDEYADAQRTIKTIAYFAPQANDNNGYEIKIYKETGEGDVLKADIHIAKTSLELSTNVYSLESFLNHYGAGNYKAQVKALGGNLVFQESDWSGFAEIPFTISLSAPQNFSIQDAGEDVTITFTKVENASKYYVYGASVSTPVIVVNYDALTGIYTSNGFAVSEYDVSASVKGIRISTVKNYFADKDPGTYSFYAQACGDTNLYENSEYSNTASYKLVRYVNKPVLSHTSQLDSNGQDSNKYYVYWQYENASHIPLFDADQTFDLFVNGKKVASNLLFTQESLAPVEIDHVTHKYYVYEISEYALPGENVVQVKANARNNYLSSTSEEKVFKDEMIDGNMYAYGYHYKIAKAYDIDRKITVDGGKTDEGIAYYIKFYSEKYANNFRFWFSQNNEQNDYDFDTASVEAQLPDSTVYANEQNIYVTGGYTNRETKLDVLEKYIKKNGNTVIHVSINFDITKDSRNKNITAERAAYIEGIQNYIITYTDLYHLKEVVDFDYDVFDNILTFKYIRAQISNIQTFVVYYKFGEDGNVNQVILSKDDCMNKYCYGEEYCNVEGESEPVKCLVFKCEINPNTVGKLYIKVIPTNAVSVLLKETEYKIYYTSQKLDDPQNVRIVDGALVWGEVANASIYTDANKIYPYTIKLYVDQDIDSDLAIVYEEFDWAGTNIDLFETFPELKNRKHSIFAKVKANAYQFVEIEGGISVDGAFPAKLDYVGYYVLHSGKYVLVTSTNKDDVGFIVPSITKAYYPQYKESDWVVSNVFAYTPSLIAPIVSVDGDALTIEKVEFNYNKELDYELYLVGMDADTLIYEKLADPLDNSNKIVVNLRTILIDGMHLPAGRYYLYAISKHTDWQVESPRSEQEVFYDIYESLKPAEIVVRGEYQTESYATKREVRVTFKDLNDISKIQGFEIYFEKLGADKYDNTVKVLGYIICVVKNTVEQDDGTRAFDGTFSVQYMLPGGNWGDWEAVLPANVSISVEYDAQNSSFKVLYDVDDNIPNADIFTAKKNYNVYVYPIGERFYQGISSNATISCLDGKFENPTVYIENEANFYAQADVLTQNMRLLMGKQENAKSANIYIKNILNKELGEIVVKNYALESYVGEYYTYTFDPLKLFGEFLGIYEIQVEFNEYGFVQGSGKSEPVYVYYACQGEGINSVVAEPNMSNLPLNLQIVVNNSIYSNVDKSTFESFYVEFLPVQDGAYIDNASLGPTYLTLTEGDDCTSSKDVSIQGKYLSSKVKSGETTTYNFAIPISVIRGFGETWGILDWNYVINVCVNYTEAKNINENINGVDEVYVPKLISQTRLSKFAVDKSLVVGKYYYDETLGEYIKIQTRNIVVNAETGEKSVVLDLSTSEEAREYTLLDTDYVCDVEFTPIYATYALGNNTYIGKYYYDSVIDGYRKIYKSQIVMSAGSMVGMRIFDRTAGDIATSQVGLMGTLTILGQAGQKILDINEYQFTTQSDMASNTLTTSNKTQSLVRVNMSDGIVYWYGDVQTTFYYLYYAWDITTNTAKLFYSDEGRVNFFELSDINTQFDDGILSCDLLSAKASANYVCLTGSVVNRKTTFNEDVYQKVIAHATYYYRTLDGEMIRLDISNIEQRNGTYYLEPVGTGFSYDLTSAVVYEEMEFEAAVQKMIDEGITFDALELYADIQGYWTQLLQTNLKNYGDAIYVYTEHLGINIELNKMLSSITESNAEWQNKWFSVLGKGANLPTSFELTSYQRHENFVYGTFIYAKKSGCGASKVLNQNFVPKYTYSLTDIEIQSTKIKQDGNDIVEYNLVFNEFDASPFTSNGTQALVNADVRAALYEIVTVGNNDYVVAGSNISGGNVSVPLNNIVNTYDSYAVHIKTKELIFDISGKQFVVIPYVDTRVDLFAPIVVNENVSMKLEDLFYPTTGIVEYTLKVKPVNFATVYTFAITEKTKTDPSLQDSNKTYYNDYEVKGTHKIVLNKAIDSRTIFYNDDYYDYYEYDLTEFMQEISGILRPNDQYFAWVYVGIDEEAGIDSTERGLDGNEQDLSFIDGTFSVSRQAFTSYKKAEVVEDLVLDLNIPTPSNQESGKRISFTTPKTEFENSVYRVQIKDKYGNNVLFNYESRDYSYCYYLGAISGTPVYFDDGALRSLEDASIASVEYYSSTQTYSVIIDITADMIKVPADDYVAYVVVIPVRVGSNLMISDVATSYDPESLNPLRQQPARNNRKLVLNDLEYITFKVDGFISEILNGEPLYYEAITFGPFVYGDLNSNSYFYRDGDEFFALTIENISYENEKYYFHKDGNSIDLEGIVVFKLKNEAVDYLAGSIFNNKKIIEKRAFSISDIECVGNWVSGLSSETGEITAILEFAFKRNGEYVEVNNSRWNSLSKVLGFLKETISRDLTPATYEIYARLVALNNGNYQAVVFNNDCYNDLQTTQNRKYYIKDGANYIELTTLNVVYESSKYYYDDNGNRTELIGNTYVFKDVYFKTIDCENSTCIVTDEIQIYNAFNIYKRHMIEEHEFVELRDAKGLYRDILISTGIDEAGAAYEIYYYDSLGEYVFKASNYSVSGVNYIRTYDKDGNVLWTSSANRELRTNYEYTLFTNTSQVSQTGYIQQYYVYESGSYVLLATYADFNVAKQAGKDIYLRQIGKVSIYEFMLASNTLLNYGQYTVKIKWIASQSDLDANILNSDLNETRGVVFDYYVDQIVDVSLSSNKEIDLNENDQYYFKVFDSTSTYVENFVLNTELSTPQINATLVYSVRAKNMTSNIVTVYTAYVKTNISSFVYVGDRWQITYNYELLTGSSAEFSIDGTTLKFDLLPYVYGVMDIVGVYEYKTLINEVQSALTEQNVSRNIIDDSLVSLYEDVYATQRDKITENNIEEDNPITHYDNRVYQNLYLRNLTFDNREYVSGEANSNYGVLSWEFNDNLRLQKVDGIMIVVKDSTGEPIFTRSQSINDSSLINLNTILLADNKLDANFNFIEIYIVFKETSRYWKTPLPFTNENIITTADGIYLSDNNFTWEPSILNGATISRVNWTTENDEVPNVISYDLQYNKYYAKDTRLEQANTPYFTIDILRMDYADYSTEMFGFKDLGENPTIEEVEAQIDYIVNEGYSFDISTIIKKSYTESDWNSSNWMQEVVDLDGNVTKPGFMLKTEAGKVDAQSSYSYQFNLKELLCYVGASYTEFNDYSSVTADGYALQYFIIENGEYVALSTYAEFTAAQGSKTIYLKQNPWMRDVWTAVDKNGIIPGQYFVRVQIHDGTNSGYQDGVIIQSTKHVLDTWVVTDAQFVTDEFEFELRHISQTKYTTQDKDYYYDENEGVVKEYNIIREENGKYYVTIKGVDVLNNNMILYTTEGAITDENDAGYITMADREAWADNTKDVYVTFRVKNTGQTRPDVSRFKYVAYYANTFTQAGDPEWSISAEREFQVSSDDWLGLDKDNYHVYLVKVSSIVNNEKKDMFGLHKFRILVNPEEGQAYGSNDSTLAMEDSKSYLNFIKIQSPNFEYEYEKIEATENSDATGKIKIYVTYNFVNYLSNVNSKVFTVNLRAYENPEDDDYLNNLPYEITDLNLNKTEVGYQAVWEVNLKTNIFAGLQGLKKNVFFSYEAFISANNSDPNEARRISPFVLDSDLKIENHMIVDGYDRPVSFSVERTVTNNYYENFVKETDVWTDVRENTDYYNLNFVVDDADAGRSVLVMDASNTKDKVAYLDGSGHIVYADAWQYYNMEDIDASNAKDYHYFILKLTKGHSEIVNEMNTNVYDDYFFLVWYRVQTTEDGHITHLDESQAHIRQIEFQSILDYNQQGVFIQYDKQIFEEGQTYYYYNRVTSSYDQCSGIAEAQEYRASGRKIYIYSNDTSKKYMLKEFIEVDDDDREIDGATGQAQYVGRYILFNGQYVAISIDVYNSLAAQGKVIDGKIDPNFAIYAKQTEVPHQTFVNAGTYALVWNIEKGAYDKLVTFQNFGLPLKLIFNNEEKNSLYYQQTANSIGFKSMIFSEVSYIVTTNSKSSNESALNHFIEVVNPSITSFEFEGTQKEDGDPAPYFTKEMEQDIKLVVHLTNIHKASAVNLIYDIKRNGVVRARNNNVVNILIPSMNPDGVIVTKVDETSYDIVLELQKLDNIEEGTPFGLLKYLPGDVTLRVQAIGGFDNNNNSTYARYDVAYPDLKGDVEFYPRDNGKMLGIYVKAKTAKEANKGLDNRTAGGYVNSQEVASCDIQKRIDRQLNAIDSKDYLTILTRQTQNQQTPTKGFNDNMACESGINGYLGTNLIRVSGEDNVFNVSTFFLIYLNEQKDSRSGYTDGIYIPGEEIDDILDVNAQFAYGSRTIDVSYITHTKTGSKLISNDKLNATTANINIYDTLKDWINKDGEITVTFTVSYDASKYIAGMYWKDSDAISYTFHFYRSVEIEIEANSGDIRNGYNSMTFSNTTEIIMNDGNKDYQSGYLVPEQLTLNFHDVRVQPTEGYKIAVTYNKNSDKLKGTTTGIDIGDSILNKQVINNVNYVHYNVLNSLAVNNTTYFKAGNTANNSKLPWAINVLKGVELMVEITPYYTATPFSGANYKIYGTPKGPEPQTIANKLSHLRDISLEYYFTSSFMDDWLAVEDLTKASSTLLSKARTQPTYGLKTSAIGVWGLRGLKYARDYSLAWDTYDSEKYQESSQSINKSTNSTTNYSQGWSNDWILSVYEHKTGGNPVTTYTKGNGNSADMNAAGIVNALNQIMKGRDGGVYYISYQVKNTSQGVGNKGEITSKESARYKFVYRKVYSDYADISIAQQTDGDGKSAASIKMTVSNSNAQNTVSLKDYYKGYNISDTLKVNVNIWQKKVSDGTGAVKNQNYNTKVNYDYSKALSGTNGWEYEENVSSSNIGVYEISSDKLDVLTYKNNNAYTSEKLTKMANSMKKFGYLDSLGNSGNLQIGQNLLQVCVNSTDEFNQGFKFVYWGNDNNGIKVSIPEAWKLTSEDAKVGEEGTGAYYSGWDLYSFDYIAGNKTRAVVYANIIVTYQFFINKITYKTTNRYNYLATFDNQNFEFQNDTDKKCGEDGMIELKIKTQDQNPQKQQSFAAKLTFTPMFGDAYESYGIKTVTKENGTDVVKVADAIKLKNDGDTQKGNPYEVTEEFLNGRSPTRITGSNVRANTQYMFGKQIILADYSVSKSDSCTRGWVGITIDGFSINGQRFIVRGSLSISKTGGLYDFDVAAKASYSGSYSATSLSVTISLTGGTTITYRDYSSSARGTLEVNKDQMSRDGEWYGTGVPSTISILTDEDMDSDSTMEYLTLSNTQAVANSNKDKIYGENGFSTNQQDAWLYSSSYK